MTLGNSVMVQWLGLGALFAEDLDSVSVGELSSHKLVRHGKTKKDFHFRIVAPQPLSLAVLWSTGPVIYQGSF